VLAATAAMSGLVLGVAGGALATGFMASWAVAGRRAARRSLEGDRPEERHRADAHLYAAKAAGRDRVHP